MRGALTNYISNHSHSDIYCNKQEINIYVTNLNTTISDGLIKTDNNTNNVVNFISNRKSFSQGFH